MASTFVNGGQLETVQRVDGVGKMEELDTVKKIVSVGREDGKQGVHIASFPCPKVNDKGLTASWKILDALAKGAALLASARALQAARMQEKIARKYYNLAKRQWEFYKANYVPLERNEIDEVHAERKYEADYDTAIKGHDCADAIFDSTHDHKNKVFSEYCICPDLSMAHRYELAHATVRGDSHNFARRYAEFLAEKKDDTRWNKNLQVASRGRGLLPQSADFANKAAAAFGDYSNAMSGLAGQAMQFSGYIRNRRETMYNGEHTNRISPRLNNRAFEQTGYTPANGVSVFSQHKTGVGEYYGTPPYNAGGFQDSVIAPTAVITGSPTGDYGSYSSASDFVNAGTGTFYDNISSADINPAGHYGV